MFKFHFHQEAGGLIAYHFFRPSCWLQIIFYLLSKKANSLCDILKQTVSRRRRKKGINPFDLSRENSLMTKINILCQPGEGNKHLGAMEGKLHKFQKKKQIENSARAYVFPGRDSCTVGGLTSV